MITSVCLNPCIDRTVEIDKFTYAGMNRILSSREDGCGKGVHVALVSKYLGMDAACIGFLFNDNGHLIKSRLDAADVKEDCLWLPGKVRTNLKIFDRENAKITEVNEAGEKMTPEILDQMVQKVKEYAKISDIMVFTGSLPPETPVAFYKTLIEATEGRCRCFLDAEGQKLTEGMKAKPFFIKPNQYELELRVGRKLPTIADIKQAALECVADGISIVAVSMGGDGAFITDSKTSYFAPNLPLTVRSTVGAGDCMVGGFLHGLHLGEDLAGLFRRGVAAGNAAVTTEGTQLITRELYEEMLPRITIEEV